MKDLNKKFVHYVSQDIVGMIGISAYILADTIFIGQAKGADGITALNLILPVYSLIYAIGSMPEQEKIRIVIYSFPTPSLWH